MRMYDLIQKKKKGDALSKEEISFMITEYVKGEIPDYQMSAMLMAICLNGMNSNEIGDLTYSMAHSGDLVDLSMISGIKVDKHSTGGVGDKTTLIVGPIVAALGVKVAKMSGRGLGHTGGTIDKLESIPGMKLDLNQKEFLNIVKTTGISVVSQSGNLAPADKKLYALRDVTATVDSIPLIASSIMSKKLAAGCDAILLDVKCGSGAFMKTKEEAIILGETMVSIGEYNGRKTKALITEMDIPLGNCIGNSLEVLEAIEVLKGKGPKDLLEVCVELSAHMLHLGNKGKVEQCREMARKAIDDGSALKCFEDMIKMQGGNSSFIWKEGVLAKGKYEKKVVAKTSGYIQSMDTTKMGIACCALGAGRLKKEDSIDYGAGIYLSKKVYDYVEKGQEIAIMYSSKEEFFKNAEDLIQEAYVIGPEKVEEKPLILGIVGGENEGTL